MNYIYINLITWGSGGGGGGEVDALDERVRDGLVVVGRPRQR